MAVPSDVGVYLVFPQGAYIVREVARVIEYWAQEGKGRNSSARSAAV